MIPIIGIFLIAGLVAFKWRNDRLQRESKAAAEAKARQDRLVDRFKHGIKDAMQHKRNRDEYEERAANQQPEPLHIKYK
jgi:hypothetical protein